MNSRMLSRSIALCTCLTPLLFAGPGCSDDAGGSDATDTETTGPTSGTTETPTTAAPTTEAPTTEAPTTEAPTTEAVDSSSTAAADDSSSGDLPDEVALGGVVSDFLGGVPLAGAEVSMFDSDAASIVTADDGAFSFEALVPDTAVAFVIPPIDGGKDGVSYAGGVFPERTGTMDRSDAETPLIQQDFIENQIAGLAAQDPAEADLSQAILIVRANPGAVMGGATVDVDMEPAPLDGTFYAPNEKGAPVVDSAEIGFATLPVAVFFNLPDTDPGDITISATQSAGVLCTVAHEEFPTLGSHITIVNVNCE